MSGGVAQLVERDNRTVEVRGSNPLTSTKFGAIAQLEERNTGSVEVRGSNPLGSTKIQPPQRRRFSFLTGMFVENGR